MNFYIESYRGRHGESYNGLKHYPYIILTTDDWNDFLKYQTLFRAVYYEREKQIYLGEIKIGALNSNKTREILPRNFKFLNDEFCSLGQSIEYYENLKEINDINVIKDIIDSLNDISFNNALFEKFIKNKYDLIYNSLLRFSEATKAYYEAEDIIYNNKIDKIFKFDYVTQIESFNGQHKVQFDFEKYNDLPNRINVIVGSNGTGKTTLLSKLAEDLSGINIKNYAPSGLSQNSKFSRIIAISFGSFDNFNKSFVYDKESSFLRYINNFKSIINEKIEDDIDEKIKDHIEIISEEIEFLEKTEYIKNLNKSNFAKKGRTFSYVYCGILNEEGISSIEEIYSNFIYRLEGLIKNNRFDIFFEALKEIIEDKQLLNSINDNRNIDKKTFFHLSSGQSSIIFILSSLIYNIENESLLIFDEPEIHLHPNAISSLMRMINKVLKEFDSYAIIATHSPIIVQEIPSMYVKVLNITEERSPLIYELVDEYFGDNITNIVNEIFQVKDYESNYKTILKSLRYNNFSKDKINEMFNSELSLNASIYLNTIYKEE